MFEKSRSIKAFDHCQVRAVVEKPKWASDGSMVCAKYPSGFEVEAAEMEYDRRRAGLSLGLGCLTCPYRKTGLQTGESAIEAIKRISSENSVALLNRLFHESDATEPPQS